MRPITAIVLTIGLVASAALAQSPVNFSGDWKLNPAKSEIRQMSTPPGMLLKIGQSASTLSVWSSAGEGTAPVTHLYPLDSRTEKRTADGLIYSTQTKWESTALLANILVSGAKNYTIMERWKRSTSGAVLTVRRTVVDAHGETEAILVYESPAAPQPVTVTALPMRPALAPQTAEEPRSVESAFVVSSGTRILLHLKNAVDTKHTVPGDRVYLETSMPVFVNQHLVIPQGSYVMGTVTESTRAGKVKGRAAMNIRFDSITLPNGTTRDFRSRPGSVDGAGVDREEGRIKGESGKGQDARTVATTTAAGAGIGTIAGAAKGAPLKGLGIGSAAGAAAGLAGVLMTRGPDVVLRPGTSVEMVVDRDLSFSPEDLARSAR